MDTSHADVLVTLQCVVYGLVDDRSAVTVRAIVENAHTTRLEVRGPANEIGKVIGKQGRTARAIRTILKANGKRIDRRLALDLITTGDTVRLKPNVKSRHLARFSD